eukprot:395296-Rhodomonas_salina.3
MAECCADQTTKWLLGSQKGEPVLRRYVLCSPLPQSVVQLQWFSLVHRVRCAALMPQRGLCWTVAPLMSPGRDRMSVADYLGDFASDMQLAEDREFRNTATQLAELLPDRFALSTVHALECRCKISLTWVRWAVCAAMGTRTLTRTRTGRCRCET